MSAEFPLFDVDTPDATVEQTDRKPMFLIVARERLEPSTPAL
jgi:hypothetical protein